MMENVELAVRCYTELKNRRPKMYHETNDDFDSSKVLVFDTETTVDQFQNLLFGSCQVYKSGKVEYECIFYSQQVSPKDLRTLQEYYESSGIRLLPVGDFVDKIFLPVVYDLRALCVGYNLPFDLSRLAISFSNGREKNRGAFSFKLSENPIYPRLVIKHIDGKRAFIHFTNAFSRASGNVKHQRGNPSRFKGNFLDLHTLAFALTNESHSLESACRHFDAGILKKPTVEHGKINMGYIEYNRNDTQATYSLFLKMKEEYEKYKLDLPVTKVYSPASIGKAYFDKMGIKSFQEKNPDFPKNMLGYIMSTYYGGRAEVRIRKTPTLVTLIDFLSMYPTMCIIQDIWKFLISGRIDWFDDTENVKNFVENVDLEALSRAEPWKQFNAICLVLPNDDIIPARSKYGNKHTYNIGLNYVTSDKPMYCMLADVVASKILTGRSPQILKAIRFVPVGVQKGLQPITMIGGKQLDPSKEDFFLSLMEHRNWIKKERDAITSKDNTQKHERLDALQNIIKIVANATSYGIFVEINPSETDNVEVEVYGIEAEPFSCTVSRVEEHGRFFNPIAATMITSGARLVLAIAEALLARHGATYAFCDTDSMAIPPKHVKEIQEYFQKLSPYSFNDKLFKLEKENCSDDGKILEPLWCYGISAKRYVLYNIRNGKPHIRKASNHGLGHILNPFSKIQNDKWIEKLWMDILNIEYGLVDEERVYDEYAGRYAISKISVSSPNLMNRFKTINKGKPYSRQIKPFNFMMVGMSNLVDDKTGQAIKPISPYSKNNQKIVHEDFIDYNSGEVFNSVEYWKPMDDIFFDYENHRESKFYGDVGLLRRKHLSVKSVVHIGKESNNLENTQVLGVRDDYQIYSNKINILNKGLEFRNFVMNLNPQTASKSRISVHTLRNIKRNTKKGKFMRISKKNLAKFERAFRASTKT